MQRSTTTLAAAVILVASTSLVCAQSNTAAESFSRKTLSGGGEGSGGGGPAPAKDQDMKAGSADSGNQPEAMTGPRDNIGATMPAQQAQGIQGREPNTASAPKNKE